MNRTTRNASSTIGIAALLLARTIAPAQAQVITKQYQTSTVTTDQLLARIVALEARVAQLESLLSAVNGQVVLDGRGGPILVKGSAITIQPDGALTLRAGTSMTVGASGPITLSSAGAVAVQAAGQLDLRGSFMTLNNGTKPVACAGAITNAVVGTVPHVHVLSPQGCGATVLVP